MHARENFHRLFARVHAEEFFVDFQNAFELTVERFARNMAYIEVDRLLPRQTQFFLKDDAVNSARRNVARNEIAVFRIPFFEKIKPIGFWNAFCRTLIRRIAWHPNSSALAARRFAHQAQLVFAGNRRRMDLNEFAVRIVHTLLKQRRLCRARAHHGVRRAPKNRADAPRAENHRVCRERFHFHRAQIHRADAAADTRVIQNCRQKGKAFVLFDFAFGFVAPHLLIERIE